MKKLTTRRTVLKSGVAAAAVLATSGTAAFAACPLDHDKLAYRLGAQWVDPALDDAGRELVATSKCPSCGAKIEPQGLSYSEHMRS